MSHFHFLIQISSACRAAFLCTIPEAGATATQRHWFSTSLIFRRQPRSPEHQCHSGEWQVVDKRLVRAQDQEQGTGQAGPDGSWGQVHPQGVGLGTQSECSHQAHSLSAFPVVVKLVKCIQCRAHRFPPPSAAPESGAPSVDVLWEVSCFVVHTFFQGTLSSHLVLYGFIKFGAKMIYHPRHGTWFGLFPTREMLTWQGSVLFLIHSCQIHSDLSDKSCLEKFMSNWS